MKTKILFAVAVCVAALIQSHAQTTFTQVTNGAIVNDPGNCIYGEWGDFHSRGYLDLIVPNYGPGTNGFYENNGNATFTKAFGGEPVQDSGYHIGAFAADYDNDGNLDLIVTAGGFASASHNRLYHNDGNGTFSQANVGGITNQTGFYGPAAWGDYDNDGYVDLLIVNHGFLNANGGTNLLFHNNGDGTFSQVTNGAIVNDIVHSGFGAVWEDYDNDGFPDLLVVSYASGQANFLYHNNRNGTFTRVLTANFIATDNWSAGAFCAAWGDYDNDGLPDLFVTDGAGIRNQLYHNGGNGGFTRVNSGPELTPSPGGTFNGCAWGDYDNDGYLDLFVSGFAETNSLFHNNGDRTFTKITSGPVVEGGGPHMVCGAVSWVDYDHDGFLDLFVGLVDATNEPTFLPGKNLLYHNDGSSNSWLEVKLIGTVSNRSAIGAKVRVHATIRGKTFWQLREIGNGGGYNCPPLVAHFGLGDATNADALRIEWPSGTVQEFHNVAAKQILTITEPPRLLAVVSNSVPQFLVKGGRGFQYEIDSSSDLSTWTFNNMATITNPNGMAQIVDTNPPASGQRFYRAVLLPALSISQLCSNLVLYGTVIPSNGLVTLSWPGDLVLEEASSLDQPVWVAVVSHSPVMLTAGSGMFFRLAVLPPPGDSILDEARRGNLNACEGYVSDYLNSAPIETLGPSAVAEEVASIGIGLGSTILSADLDELVSIRHRISGP